MNPHPPTSTAPRPPPPHIEQKISDLQRRKYWFYLRGSFGLTSWFPCHVAHFLVTVSLLSSSLQCQQPRPAVAASLLSLPQPGQSLSLSGLVCVHFPFAISSFIVFLERNRSRFPLSSQSPLLLLLWEACCEENSPPARFCRTAHTSQLCRIQSAKFKKKQNSKTLKLVKASVLVASNG